MIISNANKEMINPELAGMPEHRGRNILPLPGYSDNFDFEAENQTLEHLTAQERIEWAATRFGSGLHVLTSAGIDSALTLDHTAGIVEDVTNIDTRFLPDGTTEHLEAMRQRFGFRLHIFSPTRQTTRYIIDRELWKSNLPEYRQLTKLGPLTRAVGALGVAAYISGIRRDQTEYRSTLNYVFRGSDGEIRVNPFIDWTQAEVDRYMDEHNLPLHPLYYEGHTWLDDWPLMGSQRMECGMQRRGNEAEKRAS